MSEEEFRRSLSADQLAQQKARIWARREAAKRRRRQMMIERAERMAFGFMVVFSVVVLFIWCVALSTLDSGSWIPTIVFIVTTLYLGGLALLMGYLQ